MVAEPGRLLLALAKGLAGTGLDLLAPLATSDYDAVAPSHAVGGVSRLGVVVGNGRGLWEPFRSAAKSTLRGEEHPLQRYVEGALRAALADLPADEVRYAHDDPVSVAIQKAAQVAGLADLSPSHLCVHPEQGPWIALRVLVIFAAAPPVSRPRPRICEACQGQPCVPALQEALADRALGAIRVRDEPERWIAIRDSCPVGRDARYSEEQLRYHYTKDRTVLL